MRTASCMHSTLAIDDRRLFLVYALGELASGRVGEGVVEGVDRIAWRDFDLTADARCQVADGQLPSVAFGVQRRSTSSAPLRRWASSRVGTLRRLPVARLAARSATGLDL